RAHATPPQAATLAGAQPAAVVASGTSTASGASGAAGTSGASGASAVVVVPAAPADSPLKAVSDASAQPVSGFSLADYWELDPAHKRGVFDFRPHTPTYLIATRTAHPNDAPYQPFRDISQLGTGLAHSELVFQLGFNLKLV